MAKRRRTTGLPRDQAVVGTHVPHIKRYTGHQCAPCSLKGTCIDTTVPGGPWEIVAAEPGNAVQCLVHPTITMVPVEVLRLKEKVEVREAPRAEKKGEWNILLDANVLIEGAKKTFPGLLDLILVPPKGFRYHTTDEVRSEIKFTQGQDPETLFEHITVVPAPKARDPRLGETHGAGIPPPSGPDVGLFQLALEDPRMDILVSHDRYHSRTGMPQALGIADRLRVLRADEFVKWARKKR